MNIALFILLVWSLVAHLTSLAKMKDPIEFTILVIILGVWWGLVWYAGIFTLA